MSKLIVVVGVTGTQGGSVVARFLSDKDFTIRGTTQNPESERAKELASKGVEIVGIDYKDEASVLKAFDGAFAIYAVTNFFQPFLADGPERAMELEYEHGISMAKAASKVAGLKHYIWSTLPNSSRLSAGRWIVPHFDGKAKVDDFIKQDKDLLAKTIFLYLTSYPSNLQYPVLSPFYIKPASRYGQLLPVDPENTPLTSIGDPSVNIGIWVHGIITSRELPPRPTGAAGLYVLGSTEAFPTMTSYFQAWSRAALKLPPGESSIEVLTVPLPKFEEIFGAYGTEVGLMFKFWEDVKERSWTTSGTGDILIPVKSIVGEVQSEEVGTEEAFGKLDWKDVIHQS